MAKKIMIVIFMILGIGMLVYVLFPSSDFPTPPPGASQSDEPGDSETPLRRAYFTDLTREEVMGHYSSQFGWGLRLNYPPEDAGSIIRDQTRSTFLEEIVHPLRESVYINGFEPKNPKDAITIKGISYRQKITVRYVPSSFIFRTIVILLTFVMAHFLFKEWKKI